MRKQMLSIFALLFVMATVAAQNYPPLLNTTGGTYNGVSLTLGETAEHFALRPNISKIGNKKILVLVLGASTHGQQAVALEAQADRELSNVKILNVCAGGHDINKWLDLRSKGWANLKRAVAAEGYSMSEVQAIIFGTDDLRDNMDARFPAAPQVLSGKITDFVKLAKTQFPNLKQCDLFTRLCEYEIGPLYAKFKAPSGYFTGYADKFAVEASFKTNHLVSGVWVTDATGYVWTNGETPTTGNIFGVGQTSFQFWFDWMKPGNIHMDTRTQGDEIVAAYLLTNYKRYSWVK